MTRKDYELIADAIRRTVGDAPTQDYLSDFDNGFVGGAHQVAHALSWALTDTNPEFNRKRFLKACGIEE